MRWEVNVLQSMWVYDVRKNNMWQVNRDRGQYHPANPDETEERNREPIGNNRTCREPAAGGLCKAMFSWGKVNIKKDVQLVLQRGHHCKHHISSPLPPSLADAAGRELHLSSLQTCHVPFHHQLHELPACGETASVNRCDLPRVATSPAEG